MKPVKLETYQIEQLKEDAQNILKDSLRILEFTTQTHQSNGCLYLPFFDTLKKAEEYFDENKLDDDCKSFIGTAQQILDKINEYDEVIY